MKRVFNLGCRCFLLKDACCDAAPEMRRGFTEEVFPKQATVLTVDGFIAEQEED